MNLLEFFDYNNNCPVCNSTLPKKAYVDIMLDKPRGRDNFAYAGVLTYDITGKKFVQNIFETSYLDGHKETVDILQEQLPKTFTINKRFTMRLNKLNISKFIKPWFINSINTRIFKMCANKSHYYYYMSHFIFEGEAGDSIALDQEILDTKGFRFRNSFHNIDHIATEIINKQSHESFGFPPLPMTKWNLKSKKSLKDQINKLILLT